VKGFEEGGLCFREGRPVKGSLVGLTDTDLAESGNVQKSSDFGGGDRRAGVWEIFFQAVNCPKVGEFGTKLALIHGASR